MSKGVDMHTDIWRNRICDFMYEDFNNSTHAFQFTDLRKSVSFDDWPRDENEPVRFEDSLRSIIFVSLFFVCLVLCNLEIIC